ncbi:MAG: AAA family ATPase [Gemmatimonadetes bacterium]|nr:AAA family ATPase [Gemmatimonadota bacterium]
MTHSSWAGTQVPAPPPHRNLIGEAGPHRCPRADRAAASRGRGSARATIHSFLYGQPVFGECECGSDNKNHDARCPALKMSFLQRGLFNAAGEIVEEVPPVLIIVDEASMVNEKMAKDLIAKGVPILAVGDPGQLPPVEGAFPVSAS